MLFIVFQFHYSRNKRVYRFYGVHFLFRSPIIGTHMVAWAVHSIRKIRSREKTKKKKTENWKQSKLPQTHCENSYFRCYHFFIFFIVIFQIGRAMCPPMPTNFTIERTKNKTKQMHFAPMNAIQMKHNKLRPDTCGAARTRVQIEIQRNNTKI